MRQPRLWPLLVGLGAANLTAWAWAFGEAGRGEGVLGLALAAYLLGLRHALDADHIAAIDNVTRNLARHGAAPRSVGLWFSLGHSSVVVLACAAAAMTVGVAQQWLPAARAIGGVAGTLISAGFLLVIALANLTVLTRLVRSEVGEAPHPAAPKGPISALLGPTLGGVRRPPAMFAVGMLFGLGFDTASEVALIGIAAGSAAHLASPWTMMLYPALFAAGMSLADTLDGAVMARAYGWALSEPGRRRAYNLAVTLLSVGSALAIGAVELAALAQQQLKLTGGVWSFADRALGHWGFLGATIVALLLGVWALAHSSQEGGPFARKRDAINEVVSEQI